MLSRDKKNWTYKKIRNRSSELFLLIRRCIIKRGFICESYKYAFGQGSKGRSFSIRNNER